MKQKVKSSLSKDSFKQYLPSKKVSYIILSTLGGLLFIYVMAGWGGTSYNSKAVSVVTVNDALGKDSDGDGVPDWEESLWGTDPINSDSDGDGVPDSTEISDRKEALALANGYSSSTGSLTETDKFSRDLFITYSALSGEGTLSPEAAGKLANAAVAKSFDQVPAITTYSRTDIKVVPVSAANDLEYRKNISKLSQVGGGRLGTEFIEINSGIQNEDIAQLRSAAKVAPVYSQYLSSLLKISVPDTQVDNHIRLLNDVSYIATTLPQMAALENDIIKGYPLYTIYTKAYQDMFLTFEAIGKQKI